MEKNFLNLKYHSEFSLKQNVSPTVKREKYQIFFRRGTPLFHFAQYAEKAISLKMKWDGQPWLLKSTPKKPSVVLESS